jgi:hypothetical protein
VCICFSIIGIPFFLLTIANISHVLGDSFRFAYTKIILLLTKQNRAKVQPSVTVETKRQPDIAETTVPLFIVILILVIYIISGSFLFNYLEGWTTLTSSYFAFVTLSTIGFGDLVPGREDGNSNGRNLIICVIYIFIGMAILAMCFDLIQKSMRKKFSWIGNQMGFVEQNVGSSIKIYKSEQLIDLNRKINIMEQNEIKKRKILVKLNRDKI